MHVANQLLQVWQAIGKIGLQQQGYDSHNDIYSLINQICFLGSIVSLGMAGVGLILDLPACYSILAFSLAISVSLPLLFNYYGKFDWSRWTVAGFLPVHVCACTLSVGGSFNEESIITVIFFIIYLLYAEQKKYIVRFYVLILVTYLATTFYLVNHPPLLVAVDNPYDDPFTFLVCAVWLVLVIFTFFKKINLQKNQQEQLISELKEKNENLEQTKEELEQFTYIASHDLKSPLRTIISFLDLIKRDVKKERYNDLLSKLEFARGGAEQMNYLVTDILEYSKITHAKNQKYAVVDLQTIVDKVQFNLNDIIHRKKADIYIFEMPKFYCNETEITVLFQNFIENGIKYNEENTPNIFVKADLNEERLELQFIDNGIGMEEQYFEKIFLFFKRLHTNEKYKGTGLGLGLCKKIIDNMGGQVVVESTINVGTTFTIRLPNRQPIVPQQTGEKIETQTSTSIMTS